MEEKKKKKGGNDYLKEKIAKLEAEYKMLHDTHVTEMARGRELLSQKDYTIENQRAEIKRLCNVADENAKYFGSIIDSLLGAMGFIRRAIWLYKHREELERNGR